MKIIAHRGQTDGPAINENDPFQLVSTISQGFDVEVDVWVENNEIFLGHDGPRHKVDRQFLLDIGDNAWYHCKNIDALYMFSTSLPNLNFFWHQEDNFTLTSNGFIWTYPGQPITDKSIVVDLNGSMDYEVKPYAVCTDYPRKF